MAPNKLVVYVNKSFILTELPSLATNVFSLPSSKLLIAISSKNCAIDLTVILPLTPSDFIYLIYNPEPIKEPMSFGN